MTPIIRAATADDIGDMVAGLRRHHAEHRAAFAFRFDAAQASADLAAAIASDDWLCLVSYRCLFVGVAVRPPFIPVREAVEIIIRCERPGVRPQFVAAFESWARAKGCQAAALGATHAFRAFGRLYAASGYRPAEIKFAKSLA